MDLNFAKAEFSRSAGSREQFLRDGLPQFAFAGRSNVGIRTRFLTVINE